MKQTQDKSKPQPSESPPKFTEEQIERGIEEMRDSRRYPTFGTYEYDDEWDDRPY